MAKEKQELKVLEEPSVSHSINLNMSASDIIELYIEENLERIENKTQKIFDFLKIDKKNEEVKLKIEALIRAEYKKLPFKIKKVSVNTSTKIIGTKQYAGYQLNYRVHDSTQVKDFLRTKQQTLESVVKYEKQEELTYTNISIDETSTLVIYAKDMPGKLVSAINKLLFKPLKDQKKEFEDMSEVSKDLYALTLEYLEVSNTRKVKAKFTKKALSQTKQGKSLLEFINSGKPLSLLD